MFDPIIEAISRFFAWIVAFPGQLLSYLKFPSRTNPDGSPRRNRLGTWLAHLSIFTFAVLTLVYTIPFLWHTVGVRGWDLHYPQAVIERSDARMVASGEQVRPEGTATETLTCARSKTVDMMSHLIDFSINENQWVPSMPQYKLGFFGLPWGDTPWFDNKAFFQHGTMVGIRRVAVELTDQIGRVRGSSQADPDLQAARGSLQYDDEIWYFNPFSERLPFGPVTPAPVIFQNSIRAYERFNERLQNCDAIFDARADNLRQFLDRVSNDIGSFTDTLSRRSTAQVYDIRTKTFVRGTGNNRGWFDFQADNNFHYADGLMYVYHGIMQAARIDFDHVIQQRSLGDVWDRMETHLAEATYLDPFIVSNGRKDGFLIPDHLAAMSESMLRARANMDEIVDILNR